MEASVTDCNGKPPTPEELARELIEKLQGVPSSSVGSEMTKNIVERIRKFRSAIRAEALREAARSLDTAGRAQPKPQRKHGEFCTSKALWLERLAAEEERDA